MGELASDVHLFQLAPPLSDQLHYAAQFVRRHFHDQRLEWLVRLAVNLLENYLRLTDGQLIAFAPHVFDQHRQMQDAASRDRKGVAAFNLSHTESDVALQLLEQSL